jgi:hypothetical protein
VKLPAASRRKISPRSRVFFAEWLDPPFCAGHWLPEKVEVAGGVDVLGRSGHPSHATTWKTVFALEPALVIVGPCGFDAETAASRAEGSNGHAVLLPLPLTATGTTRGRPRGLPTEFGNLRISSIRRLSRIRGCRRSSSERRFRVSCRFGRSGA